MQFFLQRSPDFPHIRANPTYHGSGWAHGRSTAVPHRDGGRGAAPFPFTMKRFWEVTMNNCLCNAFDNNWLWILVACLIVFCCCGCNN